MPRSKSLALQRRADAVRLHREGHTFQEIADRLGYANRGTVHRMITRAYNEQIVEDIEFHRAMELGATDDVKSHAWDIVHGIDDVRAKLRALEVIAKVGRRRVKILSLDVQEPQYERLMLVNGDWRQLRQGNICAKTGEPVCHFEPPTKLNGR